MNNTHLRLASIDGAIHKWGGSQPRKWQEECLPICLASIKSKEKGLVHATMGAGKTKLLVEICASGRGRVLIIVPSIRLVDQTFKVVDERLPGQCGTFYTYSKDTWQRIIICCSNSIPALLNDPTWPGPPDLLIIDEAHKSECSIIRDSFDRLSPKKLIGFSATPYRSKEDERLQLFEREIFSYGVAEALRDGVIVPFRQIPWTGPDGANLDDCCVTMAQDAVRHGPGLVNALNIDDAEMFATRLNTAGIRATAVHSRLSRAAQATAMENLRTGRLQIVVHVSLLTEGVDFPWLRWLLMRRPVSARVRFAQEIGRVLRAAPGKTEALLYDPHDLLGQLALSYEAVIGLAMEEEEDAPFEKELDAVLAKGESDEDGMREPSDPKLPKRLESWRRYLRALYLAAMGEGLIECRVKSTRWRPNPISEKQKTAIEKKLGGLSRDTRIPLPHRQALAKIGEQAGFLTKGDASDFLSLLFLFSDTRRSKEPIWARLTGCGTAEEGDNK